MESVHCRKGDNITVNQSNNIFRILTNNVNSLVITKEGDELLEELTVLKELKVSAACLQETNRNWK
eukprot:14521485-Ditylum_brightwellii.AAC.2